MYHREEKHTPNKFKVKMQSSKTRPSKYTALQAHPPFPLQKNRSPEAIFPL